MIWTGLLLACAVSLDGLVAGLSYGIRRIALPVRSLAIVAFFTAAGTAASMLLGGLAAGAVSRRTAEAMAGAAIALFGLWQAVAAYIHQARQKVEPGGSARPLVQFRLESLGLSVHVLADPLRADADESGVIEAREAAILGVALGLDTLAVGFAAGALRLGPAMIPGVAALLAAFVWIGVLLGRKVCRKPVSSRWIYAPALLLVILGLYHL